LRRELDHQAARDKEGLDFVCHSVILRKRSAVVKGEEIGGRKRLPERRRGMMRVYFAVGIAVLIVCLGILGEANAQFGVSPTQVTMDKGKVLSAAGGRFVFGQISDSGKDQFMLDTLTGRLWRVGESSDAGMHLRPILYRREDGKYSSLPDAVKTGAKEPAKK
jgi:hypothetical protein